MVVGLYRELHYTFIDTVRQVNIISGRLAIQLSLPIKTSTPLILHNASRAVIDVVKVCQDVEISTVVRKSL